MALLNVPIIDIAPVIAGDPEGSRKVAEQVNRACEDIGFLVITGHGVDSHLCDEVFKESGDFFDLPLEEKLKVKQWADDVTRGYSGMLAESVAYSRLKMTPGDLKESYSIGRLDVPEDEYFHRPEAASFFVENPWPAGRARMRAAYSEYFTRMEKLAGTILRIFAMALDIREDFFEDKINNHIGVLRVLNYPNQPEEPLPGQLRAGEHTDYTTLTILRLQDEYRPGGLQVQNRAGDWVDVPAVPGSFVVNLGDMMAYWTNDRWISTMHRVANPPREHAMNSRRMTLVFFHETNYDTTVECLPNCSNADNPPKYPPVSAGEYLRMKFTRQVTFDRQPAATA